MHWDPRSASQLLQEQNQSEDHLDNRRKEPSIFQVGSFCTNLSECGYLSKFEPLSHNLTSMSLPLLPQGSLQMSVATQGPNLKGSLPVGVESVQKIPEYLPS